MKRLLTILTFASLATPALALDCGEGMRAFTHAAGETCVPIAPQRVVSLHDIGVTLPLVELGIVPVGSHGRIDELGEPPYLRTVKDIFGVDFAEDGMTFVGVFNGIDVEAVAQLSPDLIVLRNYEADLYEQMSAIAPAVQLDTESLGFFGTYERLADLTGTTNRYQQLQDRYQASLGILRDHYDGWSEITISMVNPYDGQFWVLRDFGALSQVMADLGIRTPTAFEPFEDPNFSASPEFLQQLDADFLLLTFSPDWGTPQDQVAAMEEAVPDWCDFLHACRNGQVLNLPREEIYSRSFVSLKTAIDFITAGIVGRDFVDFED